MLTVYLPFTVIKSNTPLGFIFQTVLPFYTFYPAMLLGTEGQVTLQNMVRESHCVQEEAPEQLGPSRWCHVTIPCGSAISMGG